jgi:putative spermidine/putrescine transport system permease protein
VIGRGPRITLAVWAGLVVAFLWIPLVIIMVYAFNSSNVQSWPLPGLSTKWFPVAWHDPQVHTAFWLSIKAGVLATSIALLLGSCAAFALHRFRFFGRELISFFDNQHINLSLWTIVIGHATFCVVIVYNNLLARLRRTSPSLVEASMDLGASGWQTFRFVTLPVIATALVSGALLAFALSFDEVVVTYFTAGAQNTLPLLIFGYIREGQQLPEVNVIVFAVIAMTVIPVAIAQRLTRDSGVLRRR